jgi:zinc transport system ATP-binding protein
MRTAETALSFSGVNFSYGGDSVLKDVSFSVPEGEFLVIMGPNGGGKTTLLKLALGLLAPSSGTIRIHGRSPEEDRSAAGYVPQDAGRNRDFPITALEAVLQGRLGAGGAPAGLFYGEADKRAALYALERMGVEHLARRAMGELSQGQRQRVLIARALVSEPKVLLLDEPLASIDPDTRGMLMKELTELCSRMTVVMVSHDVSTIPGRATAVACVNRSVFYHDAGEILPGMFEKAWGTCPVEMVAHGIPHRVLAVHPHGRNSGHEHTEGTCSHD